MNEISYAVRKLSNRKKVTLAILISFALGIGANVAIFSLVNAALLQPVPMVGSPEELVSLFSVQHESTEWEGVSYPDYLSFREQNDVLSHLTAWTWSAATVQGKENAVRVNGQIVAGNYFDTLEVEAAAGRLFRPEEDAVLGRDPVVVLSHELWQSHFGADLSLLGEQLILNGHSYTVIGVTPAGFRGTALMTNCYFWVPLAMRSQILPSHVQGLFENRRNAVVVPFGRLNPGVTFEQANAEFKRIAAALEMEYPDSNSKRSALIVPLKDSAAFPHDRSSHIRAGWLMMAVVSLVLLAACANVANLLLVRSLERRREISIRLAAGAGPGRVIRLLVVEGLLLTAIGGAVGLLVGYGTQSFLWSIRPPLLQRVIFEPALDLQVLGFTAAVALLCALVCSLAPAVQIFRTDIISALKGQAGLRRHAQSLSHPGNILVMTQVALSLISMVIAGAFLLSFRNIQLIDPGFERRQLIMITFDPGAQGYSTEEGRLFHQRVLENVRTVSGVDNAALAENIPFGFPRRPLSIFLESQPMTVPEDGVRADTDKVGAGYFETFGIPIVQGRAFREQDSQGSRLVVIVNEVLAKRLGLLHNAAGRRIKFFDDPNVYEIIGVAKDRKYFSLWEEEMPYIYLPLQQGYVSRITVFARIQGPPEAVLPVMVQAVQGLDRRMPMINPRPMSQMLDRTIWPYRIGATLMSIFGVIALILASVGIYGLLSYAVAQRNRELGLRMALGASPSEVTGLVFRQTGKLIIAGLIFGIAAVAAFQRLLSSFLYEVGAIDLYVVLTAFAVLSLAALAASLAPARRASRIDPMTALRTE